MSRWRDFPLPLRRSFAIPHSRDDENSEACARVRSMRASSIGHAQVDELIHRSLVGFADGRNENAVPPPLVRPEFEQVCEEFIGIGER
jgi:hypothetical protein